MPIRPEKFVISLRNRLDRRIEFDANNHRAQPYRYHFAEPAEPDFLASAANLGWSRRPLKNWSPRALAAAISHLALWDKAISLAAPILICEDDAILHPDAREILPAVLACLPSDWAICGLGLNLRAMAQMHLPGMWAQTRLAFCRQQLPDWVDRFKTATPIWDLCRLVAGSCLFAYCVNPDQVPALKALTLPFTDDPIPLPDNPGTWRCDGLDTALTRAFNELSCWQVWPPIAVTDDEKDRPLKSVTAPARLPCDRTPGGFSPPVRGGGKTVPDPAYRVRH